MAYLFQLAVGDAGAGATDVLDLNDGTNFTIVRNSFSAPAPTDDHSPRTISFTLNIYGANEAAILANLAAFELKLAQAREGAGPWAAKVPVSLRVNYSGTDFWFDVRDGSWDISGHPMAGMASQPSPLGTIIAGRVNAMLVTLICEPYARGAASTVTSGTLTAGTAATYYVPSIHGDADPLTRVDLHDLSGSNYVGQVHLSRRALTSMAAADFVPFSEVTALSPGTTFSDATASGGSTARLASTSAWRNVGTVTQPASTPATVGLYDLWLRARSAETLVGEVGSLTATGAVIPVLVQIPNTTFSAVDRVTLTWGAPTVAGRTLLLAVSGGAATITVPGGWASAANMQTYGSCALWYWSAAPSQSGNVTINFAANATGAAWLMEFDGITASPGGIHSGSTASASFSPTVVGTAGIELILTNAVTANVTWSATASFTVLATAGDGTTFSSAILWLNAASPGGPLVTDSPTANQEYVIIYLPGASASYGGAVLPGTYAIEAVGTAAAGTAFGLPSPTVSVVLSNAGSIALAWGTASGATSYTIYVNAGLGWFSTTHATASMTLTAMPTTSATPPSLPAVGQFRALVDLSGSTTGVNTGDAVAVTLGSSTWHWINLGTFSLPPEVALDGSTPLAWEITIQAMHPTLTPNLDADFVLLASHREPQAILATTNSAAYTWRMSTRRDGRYAGTLLSGSTPVTAVTPTGPFTLGRGDNLIAARVAQSTGASNISSTFTLAITTVPRYLMVR